MAELRKVGYPRMASFAKDIAAGTLAPAPTPDDPCLDWVGAWFAPLTPIQKRIFSSRYCQSGEYASPGVIAKNLGITRRRLHRVWEDLLIDLTGYLRARHDVGEAA